MRTLLAAAFVLAAPLALASHPSEHPYTGFLGNPSILGCIVDQTAEEAVGPGRIPDPPSAACVSVGARSYVWFQAYDDASPHVPLFVQLGGDSVETVTAYVCDGGFYSGAYDHVSIGVVDPFYSLAACGESFVATSGVIRVGSG